jgi:hypothetical protein
LIPPKVYTLNKEKRPLGATKLKMEVTMSTAKDEVESLLRKLPDDCSLEDIQYHLYVIEKIHRGIERAEKEGTISQEEAEKRLSKWIIK